MFSLKKTARLSAAVLLSVSLAAGALLPAAAYGESGKINYVALGDSIAAGVRGGAGAPGSEQGSDKGYTDGIAGLLRSRGVLGSFNKDYCSTGMTAGALARKTAAFRDPASDGAKLIRNADVITLDVGANDLLLPLYTYLYTLKSPADFDRSKAAEILGQMIDGLYGGSTGSDVQSSVETILLNILAADGRASVYVMGYYNPVPVFSVLLGLDFNGPVQYFNTFIQKAVSAVRTENPDASVFYVDTFSAMAASAGNLVFTDIHPTEAGYAAITGEFWKQIKTVADIFMVDAAASAMRFEVNGVPVPLSAYIIDGGNYVKLRDAAMALNSTEKQFDVTWDGRANAVAIVSGKAYAPVGGEFAARAGSSGKGLLSKAAFMLDGSELSVRVYNFGGNNYMKLRDLAAALDFGVTWNGSLNTVSIDSTKGYAVPAA